MDLITWAKGQWDRVAAWVLVGIGALAVILGWVGVSGTPLTVEQIPYVVSGGLGGIFLLGLGAMLWISADLRDEWRKLDEIAVSLADPTMAEDSADEDGADVTDLTPARRRQLRA